MTEATREQKLESLRDSVRSMVAGGFDSREEILESAREAASLELQGERTDELVCQIVEEEFERHLRDQAAWPTPTDCDLLDATFAELNRAGIVARQHFSCCGTCAVADIYQVMEDLISNGEVVRGYTSYDVQGTEAAVDGCGIALNYGSVEEGEDAALRIGHEVVDALARHGLKTQWDGTWAHRIIVSLDWKRRRNSTLPENRATD